MFRRLIKSYRKKKSFERKMLQHRHDTLIDLTSIMLAGEMPEYMEISRLKRFINLEITYKEMFLYTYAYDGALCVLPNSYHDSSWSEWIPLINEKLGIKITVNMYYNEIMEGCFGDFKFKHIKSILQHDQYWNTSPHYVKNYQGLKWYVRENEKYPRKAKIN